MKVEHLDQYSIFLTVSGSQAYGMATSESDWDLRGVGIAPMHYYLGLENWRVFRGVTSNFVDLLHTQRPESEGAEVEGEMFNLSHFIKLASEANPNILDLLFSPPEHWLYSTPLWEHLYERRHMFLSMRVRHTYIGYAMSQLKRVKSHRSWLLNPPTKEPTRTDFGLPENHLLVPRDVQDLANSLLVKKQSEWQLDGLLEKLLERERDELRDQMRQYFEMVHGRPFHPDESHERDQAAYQIGMNKELYEMLEAERSYKTARNHWKQYCSWKKERNPKRAETEAKFGYDIKHATHLVRLLLSVEEILETNDLTIPHPHAEMLKEIRSGAWTYDQLMEWSEGQQVKIRELAGTNPLPKSPDFHAIQEILTEMIAHHNGYHKLTDTSVEDPICL